MTAIGVFDSGIGGLTVVAALRAKLPAEPIVYLGDTARVPYGNKSPETVLRYTRRNLAFLRGRGVKALVVACNTASALALPRLLDDRRRVQILVQLETEGRHRPSPPPSPSGRGR